MDAREGLRVATDLPEYSGYEPSCEQYDELHKMQADILKTYEKLNIICEKYK
jgi:hypothetical protein